MLSTINKVLFYLVALFIIFPYKVSAQHQDSILISLLTCSPGNKIYTLFGHNGLRYQNLTRNIDIVFNYGVFDFDTPNFIYRFIKGDTDYQLGITTYHEFENEYLSRGSSIYSQELNLTKNEKYILVKSLEKNFLPENRYFRYNYFYNNCSTCAFEQIEKCVQGEVITPQSSKNNISFRSIIHEFTKPSLWAELGIDLCLGAESDDPIEYRKQIFAPFYLRDLMNSSHILDKDSVLRPLVNQEIKIKSGRSIEFKTQITPLSVFSIFLLLNILIAYLQIKQQIRFYFWDIILYGLQGGIGCIITFLFFISSHPTVNSNWLIFIFNPLPLIYLPRIIYCDINKKNDIFFVFNSIIMFLFLLITPFIKQYINKVIILFILSLLINGISHIYASNKYRCQSC